MFIEQKNGALSEDEYGLWKGYKGGGKNPVDQVHRSINKVREKFQWCHGKQRPLHVDYLVYLPDYRVRDLNAAGLDASRVVDTPHADSLSNRIQKLLGAGVTDRDGWHEKVHDFFCQTFEVVPDIQARRDSHERTFVRQAGAVATVLSDLEMTPFRLRFAGAAGSGKSLLAKRFLSGLLIRARGFF